ncbi:RNA polymerase sigma-70 factor [Bacteroides sp.]|uniref:RNA polymerase sigma factor n=1 Tax=Bacteroides sp. TaxID=29523 RepID=UPI002FC766A9
MEEKAIIVQLKEGNHKAFEWIYTTYWSQVYNFCRLYINSIEDTKEIVQQVFVKIWETRAFIKEEENFKGFLFIITRNIIFNQSKKKFNEDFYKLSVLNAYSSSDIQTEHGIEEEIEVAQLSEYINQLIDNLPPRQKEVFLLSRKSHLSYKEISTRLNISEKTVEHYISKAIKHLRQNIQLILIFLAC